MNEILSFDNKESDSGFPLPYQVRVHTERDKLRGNDICGGMDFYFRDNDIMGGKEAGRFWHYSFELI